MRMSCILAVCLIFNMTTALADGTPKETIAGLPGISYEDQCQKDADGHIACNHDIENLVFTTISALAEKYLHKGMSKSEVQDIFGLPSDSNSGGRREWEDVRYDRRVEMWNYATSLSGTIGYFLVFVDGCLDYFGRGMWGKMPAYYGRPGTRPEMLQADEPYRVDKDSPSCTNTQPD